MRHTLRVTKSPVIFSDPSARSVADHPGNVPDDLPKTLKGNGGVALMIDFFTDFINPRSQFCAVHDVPDDLEHVLRELVVDETENGRDASRAPEVRLIGYDGSCGNGAMKTTAR